MLIESSCLGGTAWYRGYDASSSPAVGYLNFASSLIGQTE